MITNNWYFASKFSLLPITAQRYLYFSQYNIHTIYLSTLNLLKSINMSLVSTFTEGCIYYTSQSHLQDHVPVGDLQSRSYLHCSICLPLHTTLFHCTMGHCKIKLPCWTMCTCWCLYVNKTTNSKGSKNMVTVTTTKEHYE